MHLTMLTKISPNSSIFQLACPSRIGSPSLSKSGDEVGTANVETIQAAGYFSTDELDPQFM
jgi:hypothetical protein